MGWKFDKVTMTVPYRSLETHAGYVWGTDGENDLVLEIIMDCDGFNGVRGGEFGGEAPRVLQTSGCEDYGPWCCDEHRQAYAEQLKELGVEQVVDSELRWEIDDPPFPTSDDFDSARPFTLDEWFEYRRMFAS